LELRFIKTINKRPIEKDWSNKKNYALTELTAWLADGQEIGAVIPKGFIVVDIDDPKTAKLIRDNIHLFGKCGLHTTPKGIHLIYKYKGKNLKNTSKRQVAGMIEIDYRTAGKGQIIYPLGRDGREVIRPIEDNLDFLPDFFKPLKNPVKNQTLDLIQEGNRNSGLYQWACKIGNYIEDLDSTMYKINQLLPSPLDEGELSKLTEQAKKFIEENPITEDDKSNFELEVAKEVAENLWFDHFHFYEWQETHWVKINSTEVNLKIMKVAGFTINNTRLAGVLTKLKVLAYRKHENPDKNLINTLSGVYNIETKEIRPVEKDDFFTGCIQAEITDVDTEPIEDIIKTITPDYELFLLMLGHILYKDNRITEQAFLLKGTGTGGNGKDTILCLLGTVFDYLPIGLEKLNKGNFYASNIEGYDCLIDTDYNESTIKQPEILKKVISGSTIQTEVKHIQDAKMITSNATIIVCTNSYPNVDFGSAGGFFRRWSVIKCPHNLKGSSKNDPLLKLKLTDGVYNNQFLRLALKGYEKLKEAKYQFPETIDKEYWESLNNPIKTWLHCNYKEAQDVSIKVDDFYQAYVQFCIQDGLRALSKPVIGKILVETFPKVTKKRVKNKGYYYYNLKIQE
jgi:putative DNA primase/helicase